MTCPTSSAGPSLPPQVVVRAQIFDQENDISGTFSECTYGSFTSSSPTTKEVVLTYGALPVPVPVPTSLEKHDLLVAMTGSASAYNATRYNGLGHPAWLISSKYYPLDLNQA